MRQLKTTDVDWWLECLSEEYTPDWYVPCERVPDFARVYSINQLRFGPNENEWTWCRVRLTGRFGPLEASNVLGACSYASEQDFRQDAYFAAMQAEVLHSLQKQLDDLAELSQTLFALRCTVADNKPHDGLAELLDAHSDTIGVLTRDDAGQPVVATDGGRTLRAADVTEVAVYGVWHLIHPSVTQVEIDRDLSDESRSIRSLVLDAIAAGYPMLVDDRKPLQGR